MIYKLVSNRVERTYRGGSRIEKFTGEKLKADSSVYYPEDWTASVTTAFGNSAEKENDGLGRTSDGVLVRDITGGNLHILVKLLDSDERLVIQAHPTREFAKMNLNSSYGKTECWYFLECMPDSFVYFGFKRGISREKFIDAFNNNDSAAIISMMNKIPVKKNVFIFVDGGVPHAIGEGCFILELQEPSDLMVVGERFTPSGRKISEEKIHMGLGYEKMFDVFDYTGYTLEEVKEKYMPKPKKIAEGVYEILGKSLTDKFSMYLLDGNADFVCENPYSVAVVTDGAGTVNATDVKKGDRLLISEKNLSVCGNVKIIVCI